MQLNYWVSGLLITLLLVVVALSLLWRKRSSKPEEKPEEKGSPVKRKAVIKHKRHDSYYTMEEVKGLFSAEKKHVFALIRFGNITPYVHFDNSVGWFKFRIENEVTGELRDIEEKNIKVSGYYKLTSGNLSSISTSRSRSFNLKSLKPKQSDGVYIHGKTKETNAPLYNLEHDNIFVGGDNEFQEELIYTANDLLFNKQEVDAILGIGDNKAELIPPINISLHNDEMAKIIYNARDHAAKSAGGKNSGITKRKKLYREWQVIARRLCSEDPTLIQDHKKLCHMTLREKPFPANGYKMVTFERAIDDVINALRK